MPLQIGDLVSYDWRNVKNATDKLGIVILIKPRPQFGPLVTVRWQNGAIHEYPETFLIKMG